MVNLTKEKTHKQVIGQIGENAVCTYLERKGYSIVDRNYLKKWGELDVVAKKNKRLYFIEVKSISRGSSLWDVPHETGYRAEDNLHPWKLERLKRVLQTYLADKNVPESIEWQFDVATVYVDQSKRLCKVKMLEDIIL